MVGAIFGPFLVEPFNTVILIRRRHLSGPEQPNLDLLDLPGIVAGPMDGRFDISTLIYWC
mgnify:CR=1 FL=1